MHCRQKIEWQKRMPEDNTCAQGYWFSVATGSGCPKSEFGHERADLRESTSPPHDDRNIRRIADGLRRMRDGDRSGPSAQHMLEWTEQEIVGDASPRT